MSRELLSSTSLWGGWMVLSGRSQLFTKSLQIIEVTIGSHIPITRKLRAELVAKFRQALEPVIKVEVDRSVLDHDFSE
jgi:hypothetical protein